MYAYAIVVHTRADPPLPQLLVERFDILLNNVSTLNISMQEFDSLFLDNDSCENFDYFPLIGHA